MSLKFTRHQDRTIRLQIGQTTICVSPLRGRGRRDRITITSVEPVIYQEQRHGPAAPQGPARPTT